MKSSVPPLASRTVHVCAFLSNKYIDTKEVSWLCVMSIPITPVSAGHFFPIFTNSLPTVVTWGLLWKTFSAWYGNLRCFRFVPEPHSGFSF